MESMLSQINAFSFASLPIPKSSLLPPTTPFARRSLKLGGSRHQLPENSCRLVVKCGKGGGQLVKEEEEEWAGIEEEWRGKCEGGKGIVEVMECLEREAIMGDDQGTDPADYNRRALIFDKSSRVFQALKHHNHQP